MGQLYVYEPWPTAVDTMGLCGPLTPTKAVCVQEKNGDFRLDIEHPIDQWGKWQSLVPGNLIKADVPLRTVPIIRYGDMTYTDYITSLNRSVVKATATTAERSVLSAPTNYPGVTQPMRYAILPPGENVYVAGATDWMGLGESWSLITWRYGRGWVKSAAIELAETLALSANRSAIEAVLPSPRTRLQLFRISSIRESDAGVSVQARHVSYDIAGDIVSVSGGDSQSAPYAATQIRAGARSGTAYVADLSFVNTATQRSYPQQTNVGAIEAMLAPSDSVTATWSTYLLRDNWIYTFLTDPAYAAGFSIEYGKNLLGVTADTDYSSIQDAIKPIGQTSKGKPLEVPSNTYTVDGQDIVVTYGFVYSPNYTYPVMHQAVLDLGSSIKAAGTTTTQLNAAYVKLIRAALAKFAEEQCDLPEVTLSVDFVNLGDTAEYAQYRDLQKLFLYDTVRVKHPRLGIDVTTQVNKTEWDCLLDRYNSIELGSVRKNYARTRVASWQVPGLASLGAYVDTISGLI